MISMDEQLKEMARHAEYEIGEFRNSIRAFADLKKRADVSDSERNRALESALLHFRILRGFFFSEGGPDDDDVFARHYCSTTTWKPIEHEIFHSTRRDLNKRVAHLTLGRLKGDKNWPIEVMNAAIEVNIEHFFKLLPASRVDWFPTLKKPAVAVILGQESNSTASPTVVQIFGDACTRFPGERKL